MKGSCVGIIDGHPFTLRTQGELPEWFSEGLELVTEVPALELHKHDIRLFPSETEPPVAPIAPQKKLAARTVFFPCGLAQELLRLQRDPVSPAHKRLRHASRLYFFLRSHLSENGDAAKFTRAEINQLAISNGFTKYHLDHYLPTLTATGWLGYDGTYYYLRSLRNVVKKCFGTQKATQTRCRKVAPENLSTSHNWLLFLSETFFERTAKSIHMRELTQPAREANARPEKGGSPAVVRKLGQFKREDFIERARLEHPNDHVAAKTTADNLAKHYNRIAENDAEKPTHASVNVALKFIQHRLPMPTPSACRLRQRAKAAGQLGLDVERQYAPLFDHNGSPVVATRHGLLVVRGIVADDEGRADLANKLVLAGGPPHAERQVLVCLPSKVTFQIHHPSFVKRRV